MSDTSKKGAHKGRSLLGAKRAVPWLILFSFITLTLPTGDKLWLNTDSVFGFHKPVKGEGDKRAKTHIRSAEGLSYFVVETPEEVAEKLNAAKDNGH